ncbi:hypothetical protein BDM02DRAFT_2001570 [Thelephora ganbajun]|uniref:Uncharacterized protein n=1 Tax=Thelephora ganbajun TaxID=370292 RepID=A0ACB6ZHD6_THEGA|nr:hypothetical protein BDM02DRAFT_2001570 [Thelephora ganbajun]
MQNEAQSTTTKSEVETRQDDMIRDQNERRERTNDNEHLKIMLQEKENCHTKTRVRRKGVNHPLVNCYTPRNHLTPVVITGEGKGKKKTSGHSDTGTLLTHQPILHQLLAHMLQGEPTRSPASDLPKFRTPNTKGSLGLEERPTAWRMQSGDVAAAHRNAMESIHCQTSNRRATVAICRRDRFVQNRSIETTGDGKRAGNGKNACGVIRHVLSEGDRRRFRGEQ